MSLQAWYPLNGNTKNYGIGNLEPIATTTPIYATPGKIGAQTMTTGAIKWTAAQTASVLNNDAISIAFWIKATGTGSGQIFGTSGMSANNNRKFAIFAYPTGNDLHLSWMNDAASATFMGGVWEDVFPANVWTHCCITYQNPTMKIYINGTLKATSTGISSSSSFAYETQVIHNSSNRQLNDFRVYDHCLSAKEVKLLSQGLVAHYKLNAGDCNNLLRGSYDFSGSGSSGTIAWDAAGWYSKSYDNTAATSGYKDFCSWSNAVTVNANEVYTASFYARSASSKTLTVYFYNNSSGVQVSNIKSSTGLNKSGTDGNAALPLTPEWKRYWITWTFNGTTTPLAKTLLFRLVAGNQAEIAQVKLEKGGIPTPYSLHSSESGMTFGDDSAGYYYNATCSGNLTHSTGSPRHSTCCVFDGSTTGLELPIKDLMKSVLSDKCTINFWANESNTSSRSIFFGGFSGSNFNIEQSGTSLRVYWNGNPDLTVAAVTNNEWAMFTIVIDVATGIKIYKNANLIKTHAAALTSIADGFTRNFNIGRDSRTDDTMMEGKMSDFRIYCTALSDADILALYQVAASNAKNGALLAYQFNELAVDVKIQKNGIILAEDFSERGPLINTKFTTLSDGSAWARIFYHNNHGGTVLFSSVAEAQNTDSTDKYSCLYLLDNLRAADGKYEFMLTYPADLPNKFNRWKQTKNPCKEYLTPTSSGSENAAGYEAIDIDWTSNYWGGLTRQNSSESSISSCYLSGSTGHGNWFYAIGASSSWNNAIPGPGAAISEVELWIRIDTLPLNTKLSILKERYIQTSLLQEI